MKKKIIISVIGMVLLVGTGFFLWEINKTSSSTKKELQFVNIAPNEKVYINGTIESKQDSKLYIETQYSTLVKVYVTDKSHVKKGDSLYRCQNETITAQIEEYKDQISVYETELDNHEDDIRSLNAKVSDKNSEISKLNRSSKKDETKKPENDIKVQQYETEIDGYKDQINSYNRQIATVKTNIKNLKDKVEKQSKKEYKDVKAPIAGTVYISDNKEDLTKPYMTIYSDRLVVNGQADEKSREQIEKDNAVDVKVVANNRELSGVIESIGDMPIATAETMETSSALSKYEVIITLANQQNLIRGYHVQAVYEVPQIEIQIPESALVVESNQGYVYKSTNGQITKWKVTYEKSEEKGYIMVSNGIEVTDKVVLNAQEYLKGIDQ